MKIFKDVLELSKNFICYNGDIFNVKDYRELIEMYLSLDVVMLGRGLIVNLGLIEKIKNDNVIDKYVIKLFYDVICEGYKEIFFGDRNVLFKMKEIWFYMICLFDESDKYVKKIRKIDRVCDYEVIILMLFEEFDIDEIFI